MEELEWLGQLSVVSDGRYFSTVQEGKKETSEFGGLTFRQVKIDPSRPVFPVMCATGRTINLSNYEFARVDVGVDAIGPVQSAPAIYKWAESVAEELLAREVASAKAVKRQAIPIAEAPSEVQMLVLRLQYGLTLNLGQMRSARTDVGLSLPSSPALLNDTWLTLESFVSDRIQANVTKLRAPAGHGL